MTPPKTMYAATLSTSHNAFNNLSFENIILKAEKCSLDTFVAVFVVAAVAVLASSDFSFVMLGAITAGRGLIMGGIACSRAVTEIASKP